MKKLGVSKQIIFVIILSLAYVILSPGRSVALALPLLLFFFEFIDQIREKRFFPFFLMLIFAGICALYIMTALEAEKCAVNLCICASIILHILLFALTFSFKRVDNSKDLYVPPFKTACYLIAVYVIPIAIQFVIPTLEDNVQSILAKVFLGCSVITVIAPILIIISIFKGSSVALEDPEEGEIEIVEEAANQVAVAENVKILNITAYGRNFVIYIKTGYTDYVVNKRICDKVIKKLAAESIDAARVSIKFLD